MAIKNQASEKMKERREEFNACNLCPRACGVNRNNGEVGYCGQIEQLRVARAALHMWEEPCISGEKGSGTVFFAGCNVGCVFCQNHQIAIGETGAEITPERLTDIYFELEQKGANNINLVTPTHFVPIIAPTIERAKQKGISIPFVYNTSAYERVETLKRMEGLIDIYLPDDKYSDPNMALKYSHAADYPQVARIAIAEMFRQVAVPVFDEESGQMKRGMIVRHLVLPGGVHNAKNVIKDLYDTYKDDIYVSIMSQYTPIKKMNAFPELNRKLTKREYNLVVDYAISIGVTNAFIQEGDTAKESFIPSFELEGVLGIDRD